MPTLSARLSGVDEDAVEVLDREERDVVVGRLADRHVVVGGLRHEQPELIALGFEGGELFGDFRLGGFDFVGPGL